MVAFTVLFPLAKAIHWLRAASGSALLVSIGVWTAVTVVSRVSADGVGPAPPVLVVSAVMEARAVSSPVANTVNGLRATLLDALHMVVLMWALLSIQVSLGSNLKRSAPLILVARCNMRAAAVNSPLSLAINRLTATTLGALLQLVLVWASKAIVQGNLAHTVHTAALILVVLVVIGASIVGTPRSNTVHRLSTTIVGALLEVIGVWASMSVVGSNHRDLVQSALLVLVGVLVMLARIVLIPSANTVHRLGATILGALHIAVSVSTRVPVVGRRHSNLVGPALLVAVIAAIIFASLVGVPRANTVHWLRAASGSALLVSIGVWTAVTVVSRVSADGVGPAPPVLVVSAVMEARAVSSPVANTVNGLRATLLDALHMVVLMWALLSIQVSLGSNLKRSAPLILVARCNMRAAAVNSPLSLAINRLTATTLGALLQLVLVWASKAIVQGNLAHTVHTAALILVVLVVIGASIVGTPRSNTVHRLSTTIVGALLEVVGVWASMSIVGSNNRDLVQSALLVLVGIIIMLAYTILLPVTHTVHRLGAA